VSLLWLHPALPFVVALALVPVVGELGRRVLAVAAPVVALLALWALPLDAAASVVLYDHTWVLLHADGLARVFAIAFAAFAGVAGIYAWTDGGAGARAAQLGVAGAGLTVVMAGDLLTLFVGWEWLTVTSLFLVWQGRHPESWGAGLRYLAFHLFGATLLLSGILLRLAAGNAGLEHLADGSLAGWLILVGMLVNAAVPPLHAWLPDAYPRASIYGTVFLAAFTTKAAVYALIRGFAGLEILVPIGTVMALVGVTFALLQDEMRRLLAYHIVSQVGYMVAGIGLGTAIALNGSASHAFSHIFYKGLLLMGAGAIVHATGRERLSQLGALGGRMRAVAVLLIIGAAAISGVPLLNGFVSKSMIVSAAGYADRSLIAGLLHLAAAGTFLSVGLKLPWFAFAGPDQGATVERAVPRSMYLAMGLAAAVCVVTGILPGGTLYALLPFDYRYAPFTVAHFVESLLLLGGTAALFWWARARLAPSAKDVPDVDRLYRWPLAALIDGVGKLLDRMGRRSSRAGDLSVGAGWARLQAYGEGHRNPTVALQTTVIVVTLVALAAVAALFVR
jgi:multicomponent Na+:H+ antiporter subunit D